MINARTVAHVPTLAHINNTAYAQGQLNTNPVTILLDSGASCSVLSKDHMSPPSIKPIARTKLVNADGRNITPCGTTTLTVTLGTFSTEHLFVVVEHLSVPAILGCDFLREHGFVLNFETGTYYRANTPTQVWPLQLTALRSCGTVAIDEDVPQAIPTRCSNQDDDQLEMPTNVHPELMSVVQDFEDLFSKQLGQTNVAKHVIDTAEATPIKVPPRQIPFHYADKVHAQLQDMVTEGIIRPSTSPWCAPAVYVPKSTGEVRICVDFVKLNQVTKKDSYPVPRAEGPQQRLAGKKVFSKLDLRSAYWQFPMDEGSIEKTAFCPGPGYGLWEFTVMPYGLTGASQTCQRALDHTLKSCKDCVDNYIDDIIVFSDTIESHIRDLRRVLSKLKAAGFTLRGSKCFFGDIKATHLGFEYSSMGVAPSSEKTKAIQDWPTPTCSKDVRSFLGLVNFFRRFIPHFADIAHPLTALTSKTAQFIWESEQQDAFTTLQRALVSPPLLDYPRKEDLFVLATDASDVGLGAVLSTNRGTVVEYASRTLNTAELNYSTTEKECLAIVWAVHKFRHYLIGAHFILETDHKPLEWLEATRASKSRSQRLERWSLELRAFQFSVKHRRGEENQHADALSRHPIQVVTVDSSLDHAAIAQAQGSDPVVSQLVSQMKVNLPPQNVGPWRKFPLRRYLQMWPQLILQYSVLYRKVKHPLTSEEKLLIVAPSSLRKKFLHMAHDAAGHQGTDKTIARLSDFTYWVGMAKDAGHYCSHCVICQKVKAPTRPPAPLQPIVTRRPWEMVGVDILKVPMSSKGNQYLLVAQDYFSKWPFAIALPDQKAATIVQVLRDHVFTVVGPPRRLHSDQGRNFESHILSELCKAFGVEKSHTTPYHPMGDGLVERMNRSLLGLLRTMTERQSDWEDHLQLLLFVYRTSQHSTTKLSPFEVLFGGNPPYLHLPPPSTSASPDPGDYSNQLQRKLMELWEMVEVNMTESAEKQKRNYPGQNLAIPTVGESVLLDDPARGKLDPHWTGPWKVISVKGPLTLELQMGSAKRIVHVNRVRPILTGDVDRSSPCGRWSPPPVAHYESFEPPDSNNTPQEIQNLMPSQSNEVAQDIHGCESSDVHHHTVTRSGRVIKRPDYYGV